MANWTTLRQLSPSLSVKLVSCLLVTILFITPKTRRRGRKRSFSSPLPPPRSSTASVERNETKRKETKRNETKRRVALCRRYSRVLHGCTAKKGDAGCRSRDRLQDRSPVFRKNVRFYERNFARGELQLRQVLTRGNASPLPLYISLSLSCVVYTRERKVTKTFHLCL